ncbi:MAG: SpoIIIAH-like family protein [Clostridia bacterium]|nr:SpoIIIAH-like family protein [Clostridia bacterium]
MKIKSVLKKIGNFFSAAYQKIGRKNLIVTAAILLICGAVYVNYRMFSSPLDVIGYGKNNMADAYGQVAESGGKVESDTDSYFSTTVMGRTKARDEAMSVLQKVADSAEALEETRAQAFADMSQIARDIESEANIEALIAAKGFADCVAVVNGSTVSVVVKSDGLLPSEIAQINEIVYEQAGALPANVKIVERS